MFKKLDLYELKMLLFYVLLQQLTEDVVYLFVYIGKDISSTVVCCGDAPTSGCRGGSCGDAPTSGCRGVCCGDAPTSGCRGGCCGDAPTSGCMVVCCGAAPTSGCRGGCCGDAPTSGCGGWCCGGACSGDVPLTVYIPRWAAHEIKILHG